MINQIDSRLGPFLQMISILTETDKKILLEKGITWYYLQVNATDSGISVTKKGQNRTDTLNIKPEFELKEKNLFDFLTDYNHGVLDEITQDADLTFWLKHQKNRYTERGLVKEMTSGHYKLSYTLENPFSASKERFEEISLLVNFDEKNLRLGDDLFFQLDKSLRSSYTCVDVATLQEVLHKNDKLEPKLKLLMQKAASLGQSGSKVTGNEVKITEAKEAILPMLKSFYSAFLPYTRQPNHTAPLKVYLQD